MTNPEIVYQAQKVIEERIKNYESVLSNYKEKSGAGYEWTITTLNSWLTHKAFFERHEGKHSMRGYRCFKCDEFAPCQEVFTQAKAIMGVE